QKRRQANEVRGVLHDLCHLGKEVVVLEEKPRRFIVSVECDCGSAGCEIVSDCKTTLGSQPRYGHTAERAVAYSRSAHRPDSECQAGKAQHPEGYSTQGHKPNGNTSHTDRRNGNS